MGPEKTVRLFVYVAPCYKRAVPPLPRVSWRQGSRSASRCDVRAAAGRIDLKSQPFLIGRPWHANRTCAAYSQSSPGCALSTLVLTMPKTFPFPGATQRQLIISSVIRDHPFSISPRRKPKKCGEPCQKTKFYYSSVKGSYTRARTREIVWGIKNTNVRMRVTMGAPISASVRFRKFPRRAQQSQSVRPAWDDRPVSYILCIVLLRYGEISYHVFEKPL